MRTFNTTRLKVEQLSEQHQELYCQLYTDPQLMRHIANPLSAQQVTKSFRQAVNERTGLGGFYCFSQLDNHISMGLVGVQVIKPYQNYYNLGILLKREFHRKGFPLEVLNGLVNYVFEQDPHAIFQTSIDKRNRPAQALMSQLGFSLDGESGKSNTWQLTLKQANKCNE